MAARRGQQSFEGKGLKAPKDSFGGDLLKNSNAKIKRPLESKLPIHLSLRNTKGGMHSHATILPVKNTVNRIAKKHAVRIYEYANVGNHLHLLIKIPQRERWAAFIRELTGQLAQVVQGITGLLTFRVQNIQRRSSTLKEIYDVSNAHPCVLFVPNCQTSRSSVKNFRVQIRTRFVQAAFFSCALWPRLPARRFNKSWSISLKHFE
jgi:REP element-mobilizing transposase RayT